MFDFSHMTNEVRIIISNQLINVHRSKLVAVVAGIVMFTGNDLSFWQFLASLKDAIDRLFYATG